MLALIALLDKATWWAGIFCGLAICFQVQVGFWGTLALGVSVLLAWRDFGWRRIFPFALITVLMGLPLLLIAHHYDAASWDEKREHAAQIGVQFADPLHVDPEYFHGNLLFAILVVITAGSVWLFRRIVPAFEAR